MGPRLLRLAADLIGESTESGCNDYNLPKYLKPEDYEELARLANLANFGDRPHDPDDEVSAASLKRGTMNFIVVSALRQGLREMARKG